jgi:oligoendopeptidase F
MLVSRLSRCAFAAAALAAFLATGAAAVERSEIPDRYRWDLTPLFPSKPAWQAAKGQLEARIPGIEAFRGRLGVSADSLHAALTYWMDLDRDLSRLYTYASMLSDEDVRIAGNLEMKQQAEQLFVRYQTAAAYIRPELLSVGRERIDSFLAADPRFADYRMLLHNILRYAPHTLSTAEEAIIARTGSFAGGGQTIREVFTSAEMPFPEITLSNGEKVRLDASGYGAYRGSSNRADRDRVFQAFWDKHHEFIGTLGASLNTEMQAHVFNKETHHFESCLEAALFGNNIPTTVYTQLISDVRANLPTLHRYLRLRQRLMGLDTLRYEDLYAPILPSVEMKYTPEQTQELVLASVAPLGSEYTAALTRGFRERWFDWMPSTGKASGAYSTGAYGVHPYQLQSFTGNYDDVSTTAHESGHTIHTYFSDKTQPYVNHDYATFVAEVASTLNEKLLLQDMLRREKDKNTQLFLLGSYLDNLRTTLFRQTLFAEFELAIHEKSEHGETLTGENLSALYLDLVRSYYGHDAGICRVDDRYAVEWSFIDHFFYNFYVFQYATSIVAGTSLANGILDEADRKKGTAKRDAYLRLLSSGSSKYPIDLLKDAGVDMTTSAPFQAAMREMNSVMDEIEKLTR